MRLHCRWVLVAALLRGHAAASVVGEQPEGRLGTPPEYLADIVNRGGKLSVPDAARAAAVSAIDTSNRATVQQSFNSVFVPTQNISLGFTGNVATGLAGTTSVAYRDAVSTRVNWFRAMAGIPGNITLDDVYNGKAQQAALMMSANNQLNHYPPSSWLYYTSAGAEAARNSNLCLGYNLTSDPGCIAAYISDTGSNNTAVGHRRWILYPQTRVMGTGDVQGGNFSYANDLWVFDGNFGAARPAVRDDFVAWPPPGFVPYQVVYPRWSFSYPSADFSAAAVSIQRSGVIVPVMIEPVANGYGENTIVFLPQSPTPFFNSVEGDTRVDVTISNVRIGGVPRSFTYTVTIFDPTIQTGGHVAPEYVSLSPFTGTGTSQTFTTVFSDAEGWTNISNVYLLVRDSVTAPNSCYVRYNRSQNALSLMNDAGVAWVGSIAPGASASVSNTQCTLSGLGSSASGSNTQLTVGFAISFDGGFRGSKRIYIKADDNWQLTSDWCLLGGWWPNMSSGVVVDRWRIFVRSTNAHLHTIDQNEYDTLTVMAPSVFVGEGVGSRVYNAPITITGVSGIPNYRLYYIDGRRHFWTTDRNEYLTLMRYRSSWTGEGIDGFMLPSQIGNSIPFFRLLFCPGGGNCPSPPIHHWTADAYEHSVLQPTWGSEGIVGYVFAPTGPVVTQRQPGSQEAGPVLEALVHAASLQPSPVTPGQLVRIYGRNLGANPTVEFDTVPARLLYSDDREIIALVPEATPGKQKTRVVILASGAASRSVDFEVAQSSPGIFASDEFGRGEARRSPDDNNESVTVYLTGRGLGELPVYVSIDGCPSEVLSMQPVSEGSGIWKLQARVPTGRGARDTASISVRIGEAYSQPGVVVKIPAVRSQVE
jgi:uncharacterized protein (TIGR03437 family)